MNHTIKYEKLKIFFINKISIELANNGLSFPFDYKSEMLQLDNIKDIELYAKGVWNSISWELDRSSCPPLLENQKEISIYVKLLKDCLRNGEQELEQVNKQIIAKESEIANWKSKCQKLTKQNIKWLQEQLTAMANDRQQQIIAKKRVYVNKQQREIQQLKTDNHNLTTQLQQEIETLKDKPPVVGDKSEIERLLGVIEEREQISETGKKDWEIAYYLLVAASDKCDDWSWYGAFSK